MKIKVGISIRHVHLKQDDFNILFGPDAELTVYKELSQPGEFASDLKVSLKTDKNIIDNVRIIGPLRNYTQVEISKTDAYKLGLNPPVRDSGDLEGSEAITLIGPQGSVNLSEGCIIANRHIHITNDEMINYGLVGLSKVKIKIDGHKGGIVDNVALKASDNYCFELHLDTDDANAHFLKQGNLVTIIKDE
ncbi:MAG: phosphate propanoyltransferase [Bacilli bacterium]|nr:phosphate propanoyltransferase [Bacilli bacterium]MDD4808934.1 phosphate propanoyltransferase [Bacilli bacterium]